jgi:serine/threonine protein phosphatase PrpC
MFMSYKSFSVRETGISHIKHGKGCEDFSLHYPPEGGRPDPPLALAVVADGHGDENCFRSARGAEFAASIAKAAIIEFVDQRPLNDIDDADNVFKRYIRDLVKHIIAKWHGEVERDYTANPVTDAELAHAGEKYRKRYAEGHDLHHAYGTTLIAAAITDEYWFGIHIGDGRFTALYRDGTFAQPVPWDERCYLNVTTSICDDDAFQGARIHCALKSEKPLPAAVFLCSDGVDDNYPVEENEKHLYKFYRNIALAFVDAGFNSTCGQLKDLAKSFATNGKGDDTSIAGIIDMEAVQDIEPSLRKQAEEDKRKAKEEEAARADAARLAAEKAKAGKAAWEASKAEKERAAAEKTAAEARRTAETARRTAEEARRVAEKAADEASKAEKERADAEKKAEGAWFFADKARRIAKEAKAEAARLANEKAKAEAARRNAEDANAKAMRFAAEKTTDAKKAAVEAETMRIAAEEVEKEVEARAAARAEAEGAAAGKTPQAAQPVAQVAQPVVKQPEEKTADEKAAAETPVAPSAYAKPAAEARAARPAGKTPVEAPKEKPAVESAGKSIAIEKALAIIDERGKTLLGSSGDLPAYGKLEFLPAENSKNEISIKGDKDV